MFIMPTTQTIRRSVSIDAPSPVVYDQLKTLDFFNRFSIWNRRDSSIVNTISGTDGTVGASSRWQGDAMNSGTGLVRILALEENKRVEQSIEFFTPKKGTALSEFRISQTNRGTEVQWNFIMDTPRPWNIFNLFYKLEKQVGADFDTSLLTMKTMLEKQL